MISVQTNLVFDSLNLAIQAIRLLPLSLALHLDSPKQSHSYDYLITLHSPPKPPHDSHHRFSSSPGTPDFVSEKCHGSTPNPDVRRLALRRVDASPCNPDESLPTIGSPPESPGHLSELRVRGRGWTKARTRSELEGGAGFWKEHEIRRQKRGGSFMLP